MRWTHCGTKTTNDMKSKIEQLQELAIWMTGCGYDFTQHVYYMKNKHLFTDELANSSNDIHNVSECMESECNSKRYWHFIYCEHHARRKELI
jgi:hypothetical protein